MLLNRPAPYPDESLISWVWRLTLCNYIPTPDMLLNARRQPRRAVLPGREHLIYRLRKREGFERLAELTHTSVETIYRHTLHRFAPVLALPHEGVLEVLAETDLPLLPPIPNRDWYTSYFVWCPQCVAEARYVRLHWYLSWLGCCVQHRCWLLEGCPTCQGSLRTQDLLLGHCGTCAGRLEQAATVPIPEGNLLLGMTETVQGWFYGRVAPASWGFVAQPEAVLLRLWLGARYSVQRAGQDWAYHYTPAGIPAPNLEGSRIRHLPILERGCLYTTAFQSLLHWPHGFFAFLDAYRERPAARKNTGLRGEFGSFYITWLARLWRHHPAFDFIQQMFNAYLLEHVPIYQIVPSARVVEYPDLLAKLRYLDQKDTLAYLHCWKETLHRLAAQKHLTVHRFEGQEGIWYDRAELAPIKERWRSHLNVAQAARRLGVGHETACQLMEANLLRPIPASEPRKGKNAVYVDAQSVTSLLTSVQAHLIFQSAPPTEAVSWRAMGVRIAAHGITLADVLQQVLAGNLTAHHPGATPVPLRQIWFATREVERMVAAWQSERQWLNKHGVQVYLEINWNVLDQLLQCGLLKPQKGAGRRQWFSLWEVQELQTLWIFGREVRHTLNLAALSLTYLVRRGILESASGCLGLNPASSSIFERAYFREWHEQHLVLAELGGVERQETVRQRLQAHGIQPIWRVPAVYLRQEVLGVLQDAP